jgi:hypothetical protein
MTQPITTECYRNHDELDYLTKCEHSDHELEHCFLSSCSGFIVNWETWEAPANFICDTCRDCGYFFDANGELVQP